MPIFPSHSRLSQAQTLLLLFWTVTVLFTGTEIKGQESEPLRAAADKSKFLIGAAVRPEHLAEPPYASTLAREFNMVEPEDALKWETVHPQKDRYDFSKADRVVTFAMAHGMKIRGHTLLWHRQNPPWLTQGDYTSEELAHILKEHIDTVVGRYRGKIFAWDVVNEAFDEKDDGSLRNTIWNDSPGLISKQVARSTAPSTISDPKADSRSSAADKRYAFIEQAFRLAHEADPQALLFYNEAEAETINPKSDAILAMVSDFKMRHVPIDGVGMQMHLSNLHPDVASIAANIKRFTALGLLVHITEMDVALTVDSSGEASREDLGIQADIYRQIAEACFAASGCTAIQTWGFTDKYSWIGSHSRKTKGAALLFDENYSPKPACRSLKHAMQENANQVQGAHQ